MKPINILNFLLTRIEEEEQLALLASTGPWTYSNIESVGGGTIYDESRQIITLVFEHPDAHDGTIVRQLLKPEADANGRYVSTNNPDRALRDCKARRGTVLAASQNPDDTGLELACKLMATVYADHEQYQAEWAV